MPRLSAVGIPGVQAGEDVNFHATGPTVIDARSGNKQLHNEHLL